MDEGDYVVGEGVATTFVWGAFVLWFILVLAVGAIVKWHKEPCKHTLSCVHSASTKDCFSTNNNDAHETNAELEHAGHSISYTLDNNDNNTTYNKDNVVSDGCSRVEIRMSLPPTKRDVLLRRAKFVTFQRNFLIVWTCCMSADWLKGPYTVALYASYGFTIHEIALLFIAGFMASLFIGTWVGALADPLGRVRLCWWYCVLFILSMLSKLYASFNVLMLGRVVGGVATSLLSTTFESWMLSEHQRRCFPHEWVQETFALMAVFNGASAVMAGLSAQVAVAVCGNVCPFLLAIPLTLIALGLVYSWHENYGEGGHDWCKWWYSALMVVKESRRLQLLIMCEAFFEAAIFIWVYAWALVLDRTNHQSPFGLIFATFMLCTICGGLFARVLPISTTLYAVHLLALASMLVAVCCFANKHATFVCFMGYEIAVGMYFASHPVIRSSWVKDAHRAGVLNLFRVPVNLVVICTLQLHLSPHHILYELVLAQLLSLCCLCALHTYIV